MFTIKSLISGYLATLRKQTISEKGKTFISRSLCFTFDVRWLVRSFIMLEFFNTTMDNLEKLSYLYNNFPEETITPDYSRWLGSRQFSLTCIKLWWTNFYCIFPYCHSIIRHDVMRQSYCTKTSSDGSEHRIIDDITAALRFIAV